MAKIQPAVETMRFSWTPTGTTTRFIDLAQCASLLNRRFYRQGLNWAVRGFKFVIQQNQGSDTQTKSIMIGKIPNTWIMKNAYKKAFAHWQKMNKEALEGMESAKPKYLDFKVFANKEHHILGVGENLLPYTYRDVGDASQQAKAGEWTPSTVRIPNAETGQGNSNDIIEFEITATGASFHGQQPTGRLQNVSLIEGYAASRALPQETDPNMPGDADDTTGAQPENWLKALINNDNAQLDEIITDMVNDNDAPPYPIEGSINYEGSGTHSDTMYPGGANNQNSLQVHDYELVTLTTVGGTTHMKGGNFPLGLIAIQSSNITGNINLLVDLVPGTQRGYLTEKYMS